MTDYIWNNMSFNSEAEMELAKVIPSIYLDRWSDAGHIAEAILDSDWYTAESARLRAEGAAEARGPVTDDEIDAGTHMIRDDYPSYWDAERAARAVLEAARQSVTPVPEEETNHG